MARKKFFVDLPCTKETREKIKERKGGDSYDKFFNDILSFDFTSHQQNKKPKKNTEEYNY